MKCQHHHLASFYSITYSLEVRWEPNGKGKEGHLAVLFVFIAFIVWQDAVNLVHAIFFQLFSIFRPGYFQKRMHCNFYDRLFATP